MAGPYIIFFLIMGFLGWVGRTINERPPKEECHVECSELDNTDCHEVCR